MSVPSTRTPPRSGSNSAFKMLQQYGLAGTAAADDRRNLAGFELKVDAFQHLLATEGFVQVDDANHG